MTRDALRHLYMPLVAMLVVLFVVAGCGADQEDEDLAVGDAAETEAPATVTTDETPMVEETATPMGAAAATPEATPGRMAGTPAATPAAGAAPPAALVAQGQELFTQLGCNSCHSTTGQVLVGPPLNNLFGHEVELASGETVVADEEYLRQSILEPDAQIVEGFPAGVMGPAIAGQMDTIQMGDNLEALVAYIKSLE